MYMHMNISITITAQTSTQTLQKIFVQGEKILSTERNAFPTNNQTRRS